MLFCKFSALKVDKSSIPLLDFSVDPFDLSWPAIMNFCNSTANVKTITIEKLGRRLRIELLERGLN